MVGGVGRCASATERALSALFLMGSAVTKMPLGATQWTPSTKRGGVKPPSGRMSDVRRALVALATDRGAELVAAPLARGTAVLMRRFAAWRHSQKGLGLGGFYVGFLRTYSGLGHTVVAFKWVLRLGRLRFEAAWDLKKPRPSEHYLGGS